MKTIMLLGAGELGKEFTISAKRLGCHVIAVDRYENAPAMQVADDSEVINMLDGEKLKKLAYQYKPDYIVPEIEAIRTEVLQDLEHEGFNVVPTAEATFLTMNRIAIRDLAARELGLRTANYRFATSLDELKEAAEEIGFPCVIKPIMSSSGKGQSVARSESALTESWDFACENMRGDQQEVIIEEFINFTQEITLLTIKQKEGPTRFVRPIAHRQERGDYQESWLPAKIPDHQIKQARKMAKKITDRLGGAGLFGVEFFITEEEVIFSELSPRPHDTGMVTLISQSLSEFDLHLRAILGLPIPQITYFGPSASAVILADRESESIEYSGLEDALSEDKTDLRIFGKESSRPYRRMGVALARGSSVKAAVNKAKNAASKVKLHYK